MWSLLKELKKFKKCNLNMKVGGIRPNCARPQVTNILSSPPAPGCWLRLSLSVPFRVSGKPPQKMIFMKTFIPSSHGNTYLQGRLVSRVSGRAATCPSKTPISNREMRRTDTWGELAVSATGEKRKLLMFPKCKFLTFSSDPHF